MMFSCRLPALLTLVLTLASLLGTDVLADTKILDSVAAVVNDKVITTYQLHRAVETRLKEQNLEESSFLPDEMTRINREVLNGLIDEELLQQRIVQLGIKVEPDELELAIKDVEQKNQLTRQELIDALAQQGMSFEAYKETLRKQILRFKLVGKEVQSKIEVTNHETLDYFRVHIDDYREPPHKRISRLSFPLGEKTTREQMEEQRKLAEEARAEIAAGADFTTVLLNYTATRKAEGGDMGTFTPGELTPSFERALEGLEEGQVSEVIETPRAFHLLFVTEDFPGSIRHYDTVKEEIYQKLKEEKTEQSLKNWITELRQEAYIDIRI